MLYHFVLIVLVGLLALGSVFAQAEPPWNERMQLVLDETKKAQVRELASDFPRLWRDPNTADRERKRMARLIIDDVALVKGAELQVHVRFKGGATRSLRLPRPLTSWEQRQLSPDVVAEIDSLLEQHTCGEIASTRGSPKPSSK